MDGLEPAVGGSLRLKAGHENPAEAGSISLKTHRLPGINAGPSAENTGPSADDFAL